MSIVMNDRFSSRGACAIMILSGAAGIASAQTGLGFEDVTDAVGLGPEVVGTGVSRCLFADLNSDDRPDAVVQSKDDSGDLRPRVFLNVADSESPIGQRFEEVPPERTGLPKLYRGDNVVFADLDNDGRADAIVTRYLDLNNDDWTDHGERTSWYSGNGDGTFGQKQVIDAATPATTASIAVGDADSNGMLDLWLGNWYREYGASLEGHHNDLLLRRDNGRFMRLGITDGKPFEPENGDPGGRPTYGTMIAELVNERDWVRMGGAIGGMIPKIPELIELNYGRRWNRVYIGHPYLTRNVLQSASLTPWEDRAFELRLRSDKVGHGHYPKWAVERMAQRDPPIALEPEKPFRSNGNTFDAAVGDVDNDGDWDVFFAEITHGWAGDSSDRSRFLINNGKRGDERRFEYEPHCSVDRIPDGENNWNQGDLFCELADFNHDTRLDLLLSSGDYPDDQRLRLFLQQPDGSFRDATADVGLDHDGSQQISLGDVNGDGALDILVGQTFFRYTKEMREGRTPRVRLFVSRFAAQGHGADVPANRTDESPVPLEKGERREQLQEVESPVPASLILHLEGDPDAGANRDALGAIVIARIDNRTLRRQLIGIGGHAGKQHEFLIHFGLGVATTIDELTVVWPNTDRREQTFRDVDPGRYALVQGGKLVQLTHRSGETPENR